jgi:hypothetical protein
VVRSSAASDVYKRQHRRSDFPETDVNWLSRIVQEIDLNGNWQNKVEAV